MTNAEHLNDENRSAAGATAAGATAAGYPEPDPRDGLLSDIREDRRAPLHDSDDARWWAALSPEERMLAIDSVRLNQNPDRPVGYERPTGARAEFVRSTPEYLTRFAGADHIARQDDAGFGLDPVPTSHKDAAPLDARGEEILPGETGRGVRGDGSDDIRGTHH